MGHGWVTVRPTAASHNGRLEPWPCHLTRGFTRSPRTALSPPARGARSRTGAERAPPAAAPPSPASAPWPRPCRPVLHAPRMWSVSRAAQEGGSDTYGVRLRVWRRTATQKRKQRTARWYRVGRELRARAQPARTRCYRGSAGEMVFSVGLGGPERWLWHATWCVGRWVECCARTHPPRGGPPGPAAPAVPTAAPTGARRGARSARLAPPPLPPRACGPRPPPCAPLCACGDSASTLRAHAIPA